MTLLNRIHRRMKINRTVRELSRLDKSLLIDIGLDASNLAETVEKMVDAQHAYHVAPEPVFHNIPATSGAAA